MTAAAYEIEQPWLPASEGLLEWGPAFHDLLLGDQLRMRAFADAIREVVRPGQTVLDLGTGTGVLACWALEAGAARVYGLDIARPVLETARARVAAAGHAERFQTVEGLSFDVELPERVDIVISETLGNLVDNEGCVPILADARERFLAPDGVLLPSGAESYLAPVAAARAHALISSGDVQGARRRNDGRRFHSYYDTIVPWSAHLSAPRVVRDYVFGRDRSDEYTASRVFSVQRDGELTGFKGWFVSTLSPTVALDISGDDIAGGTTSDSWKHCYLPITTPVTVRPGDRIVLDFRRTAGTDAFTQSYSWSGEVLRGQDVLAGFDQRSGHLERGEDP